MENKFVWSGLHCWIFKLNLTCFGMYITFIVDMVLTIVAEQSFLFSIIIPWNICTFYMPNIVSGMESFVTNVQQIDLTSTLAVLLGVPIPQNNLGKIISSALIGYSIDERVKAMQYNAHQLLKVLERNVEDIELGWYNCNLSLCVMRRARLSPLVLI